MQINVEKLIHENYIGSKDQIADYRSAQIKFVEIVDDSNHETRILLLEPRITISYEIINISCCAKGNILASSVKVEPEWKKTVPEAALVENENGFDNPICPLLFCPICGTKVTITVTKTRRTKKTYEKLPVFFLKVIETTEDL